MGSARLFQAVGRRRAVLHPAAATECDRHAAYGPRVSADHHGRADPLPPHARLQDVVAGRHRSRRHRHAENRREPARRRRPIASRPRSPEIRRARVVMERGIGLDDHQPDAPARRVDRLVARAFHDGRGTFRRRAARLRRVVSRRAYLSRQAPRALGSGVDDGRVGPRSQQRRTRWLAVVDPISGERRR